MDLPQAVLAAAEQLRMALHLWSVPFPEGSHVAGYIDKKGQFVWGPKEEDIQGALSLPFSPERRPFTPYGISIDEKAIRED